MLKYITPEYRRINFMYEEGDKESEDYAKIQFVDELIKKGILEKRDFNEKSCGTRSYIEYFGLFELPEKD